MSIFGLRVDPMIHLSSSEMRHSFQEGNGPDASDAWNDCALPRPRDNNSTENQTKNNDDNLDDSGSVSAADAESDADAHGADDDDLRPPHDLLGLAFWLVVLL